MALRTREVTTNNSALVLEMGLTTLRTYWRAKVAVYKRYGYQLISELVILKLLRQIGSGIKEINERGPNKKKMPVLSANSGCNDPSRIRFGTGKFLLTPLTMKLAKESLVSL
jgi:hypothetical protein